jgi:tetratricopeptide (TPR) repeat protein
MADLESARSRLLALVQARDFSGAAFFMAGAFREAKESGDLEAVAEIGEMYATSLTIAGRDLEAMEVYRELLGSLPQDPYLNLRVATFLTTLLKRPSDALVTLEPVLGSLLEDEHVRHASLGVWGANHAILGNMEEAKRCFRLLRERDLSKMDASSIDFLLVEALVARGEMKEQCREYLSVVLEHAQKSGDDGVAYRASSLLETIL